MTTPAEYESVQKLAILTKAKREHSDGISIDTVLIEAINAASGINQTARILELEAREGKLHDSLSEILNYSGGADNALADEYVVGRAEQALSLPSSPGLLDRIEAACQKFCDCVSDDIDGPLNGDQVLVVLHFYDETIGALLAELTKGAQG